MVNTRRLAHRIYLVFGSLITYCRKKRVHLKAAALSEKEVKTKGEMDVVTLEAQTHLPLRTQNTGRTEYVAPVSITILKYGKGFFGVNCVVMAYFPSVNCG